MPLGHDTRVGPYEIVEAIGRGAMGDVYLARDSRLNRNVAIKVISDSAADENKRRRFTQEARAASSLNHPNIVTVHDFGTQDGMSYIVSELVEGESLRDLIKRGPIPMKQLLGIAVQIAEGLAAAHDAGIVHRDLKPENIMLARDGRAKILDFGLAKPLVEDHLEGATLDGATMDEAVGGTEPGLILGTVGYMSPEQARGTPVGPQSDQFSLGLLLHEMATGHQPFRGATPMETLIQIANIERPPFTPGPVAFRILVDRCLARDPNERFANTREIVERLQHIRNQLLETPPALGSEQVSNASDLALPRHGVRYHWWQRVSPRIVAASLLAVALVALGALLAWRYSAPALGDPLSYKFTPLATESGLELFPAWSPNGRLIAYSAERQGVFQILTRSPKSSLFTQVTRSKADCWFPFWSSDGTRIYFISAPDGKPALWVVNATGGSPEMVAAGVIQAASSPNGNTLAMLRGNGPVYSLWTASAPAAAPVEYQPLKGRSFLASSVLRFTPDGKSLGLWASTPKGGSEFYVIPMDGGEPQRCLPALESAPLARSFSWLPDGRRLLFAERNGFWSSDHLWVADTRTNEVRLVTNGTGREQWPAVSPGGHDAAFSAVDVHHEILQASLTGDIRLERLQAGELSQASPAWSPVSDEYAYVTGQAGEPEIRLRNADSGWERKLVGARDFEGGANTLSLSGLAFAPNGQSVAFSRAGDGAESIWIAATSGEPPVRLARQPDGGIQRSPAWSPDGNWIAFDTIRNGRNTLEKARVGANSAPVVVRDDAGVQPRWSPAGRWIALIAPGGGLNLVSEDGAQIRHLGSAQWLAIAWTRNGSRILAVQRGSDAHLALAAVDPESGAEARLADFGPYPAEFSYASATGLPPVCGFTVSPDSKGILMSAMRVHGDLWLLQGLSRR